MSQEIPIMTMIKKKGIANFVADVQVIQASSPTTRPMTPHCKTRGKLGEPRLRSLRWLQFQSRRVQPLVLAGLCSDPSGKRHELFCVDPAFRVLSYLRTPCIDRISHCLCPLLNVEANGGATAALPRRDTYSPAREAR